MSKVALACGVLIAGLAALPGTGVGPARAQCSYTALSSGTAVTVSSSPQPCSFNQSSNRYYAAVAARPASGDWNVEVYQSTDAFPACVATLLGSSTRTSGVDFVVGDFNYDMFPNPHNPLGTYYPLVTRVSGGDATVEWDDGPNSLVLNAPLLSRSTGSSDVIEVWDANLTAGTNYTFTFAPTGADLKLLLFKSGAGTYWAGRNAALFEVTTTTTFTPSSSGFHGVVVINDNGAAGSYALGVGTCQAPTSLVSGTTATTLQAEKYYSFSQSATFWTAVGVRGASDWNLEVYQSGSGAAYPVCFATQLGASALATPVVDFVVGDFNELLIGTHYARVHLNQDLGSGTATVEWDDGLDFFDPDPLDPPPGPTPTISRTTGPTDVLEVWDVYFENNVTYQIYFNTTGADLRLFLFPPSVDWAGRSAAVHQQTGGLLAMPFTAGETDYYGLVVVNDNGAVGSYELRVFREGIVGVGDRGLPPTSLGGVGPNPAHGAIQIHFALHEAAPVSFEILDIAGRRVAETPARVWEPGRWSTTWRPEGPRVSAGIYFVTMKVGERVIARRKFALIR